MIDLKKKILARHWWFIPVILVTQEAEIRMVIVQRQAWVNSLLDPISKKFITHTHTHTHTHIYKHTKAGGVAQSVGPEFIPWYCKIN
jgi:hypothetical protein